MARSGGIEYEDITNIKKNTRISTLGNDASENMQVKMVASSWFNVRKVDFGTGAAKVTVRAKGTGKLDIRTSLSPRGTIATLEFSSEDMEEKTIDVDATKFKGVKNNIYFVVSEGELYVDSWQFRHETDGINEMEAYEPVKKEVYDLSGRKLTNAQNHRGMIIEQYTDKNGVKRTRKTF